MLCSRLHPTADWLSAETLKASTSWNTTLRCNFFGSCSGRQVKPSVCAWFSRKNILLWLCAPVKGLLQGYCIAWFFAARMKLAMCWSSWKCILVELTIFAVFDGIPLFMAEITLHLLQLGQDVAYLFRLYHYPTLRNWPTVVWFQLDLARITTPHGNALYDMHHWGRLRNLSKFDFAEEWQTIKKVLWYHVTQWYQILWMSIALHFDKTFWDCCHESWLDGFTMHSSACKWPQALV